MSVGPVIYKSEFIKDFYQRVIQDSGTFEGKLSSYTNILDELALSGNVYDFLCVPNAYKTSKIYSIFPNNADNDLTFSRNSNATKVNKNGIIEVVDNDEPRIDYSISSTPVILSEESKSNLILSSENYDTINWNNNGAILDPQTVDMVDIYETNLATKVTGSNTNTLSQDIIIPADDTSYTASIFVKKGDSENITLALDLSNGTALNFEVNYNFSTSNLSSIGTDTPDDITSFKLKNGWIRISITCTNNSTNDKGAFTIKPNNDSASSKFSYFIGTQLEINDLTSYIPSNIENREEDIIETSYNSDLTVDVGEDQIMSNFSSSQLPKGRILSIKGNLSQTVVENYFSMLIRPDQTTNEFTTHGAEGDYDVRFFQNDNLISHFPNISGEDTFTLPTDENYEIRIYPKGVNGFNRISFDVFGKNGDVLEVLNWGYINWSTLEGTFANCSRLTSVSKAGSIRGNGGNASSGCFESTTETGIVPASNIDRMFFGCDLESIPEELFINCTNVTTARNTFGNSFAFFVPSDIIPNDLFNYFPNLTNVAYCFSNISNNID